jgi:pSer/pThr/pTyr-binding forkhead associated (FHA) protein
MNAIDPIFLEIDRLIRLSRLKEMEFMMSLDVTERVQGMTAALERLVPGEYLLGTGPSTVGIFPLSAQDVVLGRPPTVIEEPARDLADCCAVDTLYFVPREISRTHAKVVRQTGSFGVQHVLIDLHSTCGTLVNEVPVDPNGTGVVLEHGDIISLGPSHVSTYIYYRTERVRCGCA